MRRVVIPVSRLLDRTEAFKVKAVFLGDGVRIEAAVIGGDEVEPTDRTGRLLIKSIHVSTSYAHFPSQIIS